MVSFAKLLRIRQGIGKKYKNIGLEKFLLSNINFRTTLNTFLEQRFDEKEIFALLEHLNILIKIYCEIQ